VVDLNSQFSRTTNREPQNESSAVNHPLLTNTETWSALWSAWKDWGNRIPIDDKNHFVVNGYANGWFVPVGDVVHSSQFTVHGKENASCQPSAVNSQRSTVNQASDFQIVLEFEPQRWFEVGCLVSATTLLLCLGYFGYAIVRRRKK